MRDHFKRVHAMPAVLTLTAEEIRLVRHSFASLNGTSESMAMVFYGRLFELDPTLRSLFKIPVLEQSRKLVDTVRIAIEALDHFETIRPQLAELGRRHVSYGTQPVHYEIVNTALLWALQQTLGDAFNAEIRSAWQKLLTAVTRAMLESCELKGHLLDTYERAVQEYNRKLSDLRSKVATLSRADYERLRNAVEKERLLSEKARSELAKHVRRHKC